MFEWFFSIRDQSSPAIAGFNSNQKQELESLTKELLEIGRQDDFLSEHPGGVFNGQCKHRRARQIGELLSAMGGVQLMWWMYERIKRRAGQVKASHLEYCWAEIGEWLS
jgi:hypothetical protein